MAVPFRIGFDVGQAEIRREVHNLQMLRQRRHRLLRRAVRQAAEHDVMGAEIHVLDAHQVRQAERGQVREDPAEGLARAPVGGERADLDMRMAGQQADQLRAGIAARAQDRRPGPVSHLGHGSSPLPVAREGPRRNRAIVLLPKSFRSPVRRKVSPGPATPPSWPDLFRPSNSLAAPAMQEMPGTSPGMTGLAAMGRRTLRSKSSKLPDQGASASRTGSCAAPSACRISCARRGAHRGSGTRPA